MIIKRCEDGALWNELLAQRQPATIFHRYEWGKAMEELPDVTFHPYLIEDEKGTSLLPVYQQRGTWSWSMLGYGGPCVEGDATLSFQQLSARLEDLLGGAVSRVALPFHARPFHDVQGLADWGERETHLLELPATYEELWNSCSGKARTSVRQARKHGVQVRVLGVEHADAFYRMYVELMERLNASYVLSEAFFQKADELLDEDAYCKLGAFADGKLIAASLFLLDQTSLYYWIHVNNESGRKCQASYLLLEEAYQTAIARGIRWADLGSSHDPAIARPKEYWGAKPVPCAWFQKGARG